MNEFDAQVLLRPSSAELRYLPEGPCHFQDEQFSWVAIQHGAESVIGSLNISDLSGNSHQSFELPGRPGFAFHVGEGKFFAGVERHLGHFDINDQSWTPCGGEIDAGVKGTIINDGERFAEGVVFGSKDLSFSERKAGLYLWRESDQQLLQLRDDQVCSNGKALLPLGDHRWKLYDIDSPTKTVVSYELDVREGTLSDAEIVLDFRNGEIFPDGMVSAPNQQSLIIAFFNPGSAEYGVARQFRLSDGMLEAEWRTAGSPRVTCPQILDRGGEATLVLTTADEGMSAEQQAAHPQAGCLFFAPYSL